jgi:hypothetical protein
MKTSLPALFFVLVTAALAPNAPAAAGCTLEPLVPRDTKVTAGAAALDLGAADDPSAPTAWQGPLTTGTCSFDIGIIERPMALAPFQLLYVTTYSGSMRTVTLVDLNKCAVRWKSRPFAGKADLTPSALTLGHKHVALDAQCLPAGTRTRK